MWEQSEGGEGGGGDRREEKERKGSGIQRIWEKESRKECGPHPPPNSYLCCLSTTVHIFKFKIIKKKNYVVFIYVFYIHHKILNITYLITKH